MYSFQSKGHDYYFYLDGAEMQTPTGNVFKTDCTAPHCQDTVGKK